MTKEQAVKRVLEQLKRAQNKHPKFTTRHEGYAVILEELDEAFDEIKANDDVATAWEVAQVAACAIRYLMDLVPENFEQRQV